MTPPDDTYRRPDLDPIARHAEALKPHLEPMVSAAVQAGIDASVSAFLDRLDVQPEQAVRACRFAITLSGTVDEGKATIGKFCGRCLSAWFAIAVAGLTTYVTGAWRELQAWLRAHGLVP